MLCIACFERSRTDGETKIYNIQRKEEIEREREGLKWATYGERERGWTGRNRRELYDMAKTVR